MERVTEKKQSETLLLAKRPKQMVEHRELRQEWSELPAVCHEE